MTTSELWIKNLSGGRSLYQHGGLFGPASDVAYVLLEFIHAGSATAHPDHADVADLQSTISGDLVIQLLVETQKQTGKTLTEDDGSPSINCVNRSHRYEVRFIEF